MILMFQSVQPFFKISFYKRHKSYSNTAAGNDTLNVTPVGDDENPNKTKQHSSHIIET